MSRPHSVHDPRIARSPAAGDDLPPHPTSTSPNVISCDVPGRTDARRGEQPAHRSSDDEVATRSARVASGDADRVIARLAGRQQGVVSRKQLLEAGLSTEMIRHRRARGRLHELTPPIRGAYLVGHAAATPLARERAALLVCGADAVLSHATAARIWALEETTSRPEPIDVLVVGRRGPRRPGIRGRRAAALPAGAWRWHRGLPLTSPARTILDLAAIRSADDLVRIVDRARIARLLRDGELRRIVDGCPRRRGVAALRAMLDDEQGPGFSRSEAERVVLRVIRTSGLPAPSGRNVRSQGRELDLVWARERVVLEVDGRAFHSTPARFESDRERDGALHASGHRVLRVTWRMLRRQPEVVVARLAAILALAERDVARDLALAEPKRRA